MQTRQELPAPEQRSDAGDCVHNCHILISQLMSRLESCKKEIQELKNENQTKDILIQSLETRAELEAVKNAAQAKTLSVEQVTFGQTHLAAKYAGMSRLGEKDGIGHRCGTAMFDGYAQRVMIKKIAKPSQTNNNGSMPAENGAMEVEMALTLCNQGFLHFPRVLDVVADNFSYWIVSPFQTGGDIFQFIASSVLVDVGLVKRYAKQMIESVQLMHLHGYCHLDISPENFLIDKEFDHVLLIDYGATRKLNESGFPAPTKASERPGKASYRSPQIHNREPFDGVADDIWSLGVTIYTMVAQSVPWKEPDMRDKDFASMFGEDMKSDSPVPQKSHLRQPPSPKRSNGSVKSVVRRNHHLFDPVLVDFLDGMLRLERGDRRSLQESSEHPWLQCERKVSFVCDTEDTADASTAEPKEVFDLSRLRADPSMEFTAAHTATSLFEVEEGSVRGLDEDEFEVDDADEEEFSQSFVTGPGDASPQLPLLRGDLPSIRPRPLCSPLRDHSRRLFDEEHDLPSLSDGEESAPADTADDDP